jgi:hypothetical protein
VRFAFHRLRLADGSLDYPRPMLSVCIIGPRRRASQMMLVDSGASDTILSKGFLESLGVQFTGEKQEVYSFAGDRYEAEVAAARLSFGGGRFELSSRVLAFPGGCVAALGIRDFFNRYIVTIDAGGLVLHVTEPRAIVRH